MKKNNSKGRATALFSTKCIIAEIFKTKNSDETPSEIFLREND